MEQYGQTEYVNYKEKKVACIVHVQKMFSPFALSN